MMSKRSPQPVSSFGPELLAALIKGSKEPVVIKLANRTQGRTLQLRIQMLRGAMQREGHPMYAIVTRVKTSLKWGNRLSPDLETDVKGIKAAELHLIPRDSEFGDAIRRAGVEVTETEGDLLGNPETVSENRPATEVTLTADEFDPLAKYLPKPKLEDLA
jgi:hypothetical protein